MNNNLTVENANDFYRIHFHEMDFGVDYNFDSSKVKESVVKYGFVFTACDYNVYAIVIKKLIQN